MHIIGPQGSNRCRLYVMAVIGFVTLVGLVERRPLSAMDFRVLE